MAAYVITQVDVHDPATFETYREKAGPVLDALGGRFLVRGGAMEVLEGAWAYPRGVLIRFDDVARAKRWHGSDEYGVIKAIRHESATANMVIIDGLDGAEAPAPGEQAGYVIAQVDVKDTDAFEAYRARVPETLGPYGGRFLVRGGEMTVLEGEWAAPRCVVLTFPSFDHAKQWWASEIYAEPKAMRQAAADTNLIVVEGV